MAVDHLKKLSLMRQGCRYPILNCVRGTRRWRIWQSHRQGLIQNNIAEHFTIRERLWNADIRETIFFWGTDRCRRKIEGLFGVREEEGIVLYAPTFRETDAKDEERLDFARVCDALKERFERKYRMFVRFHPSEIDSLKNGMFQGNGITNATAYEDTQELLAAADILITDYSSIMWDFSLQKKPVFLFHSNGQKYDNERGFYLPFERMPYIEALDNAQLCEKIGAFDRDEYENALMKFLVDYGSFDRGTASRAVSEWILNILDGKAPETE